MDQVDTLVNLKEKLEGDVSKFGSEPTLKLEKSIKGLSTYLNLRLTTKDGALTAE
mgnify:CR=1 FL=1